MTEKELARHHAEILVAWADGKEIEYSPREEGPWSPWTHKLYAQDFGRPFFFRIKPQPREFTVEVVGEHTDALSLVARIMPQLGLSFTQGERIKLREVIE